MEIIFLGGAREVGKMGIMVKTAQEKFLMDYGVNVQSMAFPIEPEIPTAMILSHAHLDHSGHLPCLYKRGFKGSTIATPVTFDLSELLLTDAIKVQKKKGLTPHYVQENIEQMLQHAKAVNYKQKVHFESATVELLDAGHIPGAATTIIETKDKRLAYTGDINFADTVLVKGADTDLKDVDVLISESTYSYKNHPDRAELADKLREMVQDTVHNNGFALLPSFAVGRTQEMILLMQNLGFPVYTDGMGIEAASRILSHPESVKDPEKLRAAFSTMRKIGRPKQRQDVSNQPGAIIASAGMLMGGPIQGYIKKFWDNPNCLMVLNGYQIEGTPGRRLLETGRLSFGDFDVKPKMRVEFLDFSAHCGRDDLIKFYKKVNPGKLILVHGDRTEQFAAELKEEHGFDAEAPKNGDRMKLK